MTHGAAITRYEQLVDELHENSDYMTETNVTTAVAKARATLRIISALMTIIPETISSGAAQAEIVRHNLQEWRKLRLNAQSFVVANEPRPRRVWGFARD